MQTLTHFVFLCAIVLCAVILSVLFIVIKATKIAPGKRLPESLRASHQQTRRRASMARVTQKLRWYTLFQNMEMSHARCVLGEAGDCLWC